MERIHNPHKASVSPDRLTNVHAKKPFMKRRGNLPKQSVEILRTWLSDNRLSAYPSENQKKQLAHESKLTLDQVSNWFINARRRILPDMLIKSGRNPADFRITRKRPKTLQHSNDNITDSESSMDTTTRESNGDSDELSSPLNSSVEKYSYSNDVNHIAFKKTNTSAADRDIDGEFKALSSRLNSYFATDTDSDDEHPKALKKLGMEDPKSCFLVNVGTEQVLVDTTVNLKLLAYVACGGQLRPM